MAAARARRVRRRSILADGRFLSDYHPTTPPIHDINAHAKIIHNGALTMGILTVSKI